MHGSKQYFIGKQQGISIGGLIVGIAIGGLLFIFAAKVFPTFVEFRAAKAAIVSAKSAGGSVREMQTSFDKSADINTITTITGKDLIFSRDGGEVDISFDYEVRIPIIANATLLLQYSGTTAKSGVIPARTAEEVPK
jgi:hypothetical protein